MLSATGVDLERGECSHAILFAGDADSSRPVAGVVTEAQRRIGWLSHEMSRNLATENKKTQRVQSKQETDNKEITKVIQDQNDSC